LTGGFVISHQSFGMSFEISEKIKSEKKHHKKLFTFGLDFIENKKE